MLLFVFASFLAFVPLIIAAVSILTTFLLVLGLTYLTDVSFVVQFLIALVGLGVAIDYSLLLVSRWREERAHGRPNDEAVVVAMQTAGHAVVASGVTVAISLLALIVVPVPFLRSMGLGGMLIPLVSVVGGADAAAGDAVQDRAAGRLAADPARRRRRPRLVGVGAAHRPPALDRRRRRRWSSSGLIIAPVFGLKIGQSEHRVAGQQRARRSTPCRRCEQGGVGDGVVTPIAVLVPDDQAAAAVAAADGVPGVRMAVVGGSKDGTTVVDVLPDAETVDSASIGVVDDVRTAVEGATDGSVGVAGTGAIVQDYFRAVYDNFPYVLALIARDHVRPAGAHLPVAAAADQGGAAQPGLAGRGVRLRHVLLAGGARLGGGVRGLGDRRDHVLAAGDHLRVPVRPVDGLRGVHPRPHAGGVRRDRAAPRRPWSPASAAPGGWSPRPR